MRKKDLLDVLFGSKVRQGVLAATLLDPERSWYLSDLARHLDVRPSTLQRELAGLTGAGVLSRREEGNRTYYRADTACPVFAELRGLLLKTAGLHDVVRASLADLADRIDVAFLYGSIARAEAHSASDVDVMILGRVGLSELVPALKQAEEQIGRPINPSVYAPEEFAKKLAAGHHFLTTVMNEPKIYLWGDERELATATGKQPSPKAHDE